MIKLNKQLTISLSKYVELYDLLIDENNFWKQLNEVVNFYFCVDIDLSY